MRMRGLIVLIVAFLFTTGMISAGDSQKDAQNKIKNYFKDVMVKVVSEKDVNKKREILNSSLQKLDKALSLVTSYSLSDKDIFAINSMRSDLKAKLDELNGSNGYEKVPDNQLNNFSTYMMQHFETADTYLYVSVTALIIIALLLILLL